MKTIKQKLLMKNILTLLAVIMISLITGLYCSYQSVKSTVESDLKAIGHISDIAIDASIQKYKQTIQSIAEQSIIGDPKVTKEQLLNFLKKENEEFGFESLLIADEKGNCISTDSSKDSKSIADYDAFKQTMEGKTILSEPTKDVNGTMKIFLNTKINNQNGFNGIISATLNCQLYSNIIKGITIGQSGNAFILDNKGTTIAHVRPEDVEKQVNIIEQAKNDKSFESTAKVFQNMISGKTGYEGYSYANENRLCYYGPLEGTNGWSMAIAVPENEMMSSLWTTIVGLLISGGIFIIIGIFISISTANSIANPISKMSKRLKALSNGDITGDIEQIESNDEIGILYQSLKATITSLQNYISEIDLVLGKVANGELNIRVEQEYIGDFSSIKTSLEKIISSLNETMVEIKNASEQVSSGSAQIADGSQALSQGATEQASSIEELSATVSEISEDVKANAHNANIVQNQNKNAQTAINHENEQMQNMIEAMAQISNASSEISKIIKTIDDIAFQTNILALNAAVEAARAGEAGKGFSVVADEVRNLASKSAQAAKNTTGLIESALSSIENGKQIADETAQSLGTIVSAFHESNELISQIADASNHQATAISQISQGVEQISAVVQTNSATAEESAAASEELSSQAKLLNDMISHFKIK